MPINYNPDVRPDTQSFALGLARMGMAVNSAIEEKNEEEKRRGQLAKTLRTYATQAGIMPKERADQMGIEELQGTVQAHHVKVADEERQQRAQQAAQQLLYYKTLTAGQEQTQRARGALPKFAAAYAQRANLQGPALPGSPISAGLEAAPEAAGSPELDNLISSLTRANGTAGAPAEDTTPRPVQLNLPDGRAITVLHSPGSRDFKFVPSDMTGAVDEQGNIAANQMRTLPDGTVQTYNGRAWINVPKPKQATLPDSFNKTMDEVTADIAAAQAALADPALKPDQRTRYERSLKTAQQRGRSVIDRYATQKLIDDDQKAQHYAELGIAAPAAKTPPPAETPAATGKVKVTKGGKQFWLPSAQLEEAKRQGYSVVE